MADEQPQVYSLSDFSPESQKALQADAAPAAAAAPSTSFMSQSASVPTTLAEQTAAAPSDQQIQDLINRNSAPPRIYTQADFKGGSLEAAAIPGYADGLSPDRAQNESPLSFLDKVKISVGRVGGDPAGEMKYLKDKGYETAIDPKTKELTIKDPADGSWKYAHEQNPWRLSSLINDSAEQAGPILSGAVQGMVAGGLALMGPAGLASEGVVNVAALAAIASSRVSLGKMLGTYDDTKGNETADVALETILGTGGWLLGKGVMPLLGKLGSGVKSLGEALGRTAPETAPIASEAAQAAESLAFPKPPAPDASRGMLNRWLAGAKGVDETQTAPIFTRSAEVASIAQRADLANASPGTIKQILTSENIDHLKAVGDACVGQGGIKSAAFNVLQKDLLQNTPETFVHDPSAVAREVFRDLHAQGIISVEEPVVKGASALPFGAEEMATKFDKADLSQLNIRIKTPQELLQSNQGSIALQPRAQKMVSDLITTIKTSAGAPKTMGQEGMKALVSSRRALMDTLDVMKSSANAGETGALKFMNGTLSKVGQIVDNTLTNTADETTAGAMSRYLKGYNGVASVLKPLTDAAQAGGRQPFETLLNQFLSKGGENVVSKDGINAVLGLAKQYSPAQAKMIEKQLQTLMNKNAVSLLADHATASIGNTSSVFGFAKNNLADILSAGIKNDMGMPQSGLVGSAAGAASALKDTAMNTARAVKGTISALPQKAKDVMLQNPAILQQVMMAPITAARRHDQTRQQLMQHAQGIQQQSQQAMQAHSQMMQQRDPPPKQSGGQ